MTAIRRPSRPRRGLQTSIGWAQAELSVSNCAEARQQVAAARKLAGGFAASDPQVRRLDAVEQQLAFCSPGASPALQSPSPVAS